MKQIYILIILFNISISTFCQYHKETISVLQKGLIGKEFKFGNWTVESDSSGDIVDWKTEAHIKYIGTIKTKTGRVFNLVNYYVYWGLTPRVTSELRIYNDKKQYVGYYKFYSKSYLPYKLINNRLIFLCPLKDKIEQDKKIISLENGLPKSFVLKLECGLEDIIEISYDDKD